MYTFPTHPPSMDSDSWLTAVGSQSTASQGLFEGTKLMGP